MSTTETAKDVHIVVTGLTMAYGSFVVQRDLTFTINRGDIFIIMGGSGCGKSRLLRHMIGLKAPAAGTISYDGVSFWDMEPAERERIMRQFGILYQSGALFSSMTLAENVSLPLQEYTDLSASQIQKVVSLKLALVGLAGFDDYYPSEISGGMQKRAGLARAMALDPDILFFDEPSAGLDPISSRLLDGLILELRASWSVYSAGGKTELLKRYTNISEPVVGDDIAALVQAQSRAVETLSRQIAEAVKALSEGKPAGASK